MPSATPSKHRIRPEKLPGTAPHRRLVLRAAEILKQGGVVAYPTETSYGLGALVSRPEALERIYRIKNRPEGKPLLVLVAHTGQLDELVERIPAAALPLIDRFWPGPLTLLFPARPGLPRPLCGDTGKVGIRISAHPWAQALVLASGRPITATSANLSGRVSAVSAQDVASQLRDPLPDFILDGGPTPGGLPSTILDVSGAVPRLVRPGVLNPEDIPGVRETGRA